MLFKTGIAFAARTQAKSDTLNPSLILQTTLIWRRMVIGSGEPSIPGRALLLSAQAHTFTPFPSLYTMFPEAKPGPQPQGLTARQRKSRRADWAQASDWDYNVTSRYKKSPMPYDEGYREEFWEVISSAGIVENLHEPMAAYFPTLDVERGSKWYLRNPTQKGYIRMEFVTTTDGEITVALAGKHWLTLDILLMWLISWNQKGGGTTFTWEEFEQGEAYDDIQDTDLMAPHGRRRWIEDVFMLMKAGKLVAHALDVVDEETAERWFDRATTIDWLADNWLRALYGEALARKGDEDIKEYWAKFYEKSKGRV